MSLQRLSLRMKFALTVTLAGALITAVLAALYLQRSAAEARASFISGQELFALAFFDGAARYLESERLGELGVLTRTTVLGNYLYAQVVRGGKPLVTAKVPPAKDIQLDLLAQPPRSRALVRQLPTGQRYLDIVHSFSLSGGSADGSGAADQAGYVRIGVSLAPMEAKLRSQMLTIAGLSLALVILVFGLAWAAAWLLLRETPEPQGEPSAASSEEPTTLHAGSTAAPTPELQIDDATKRVIVHGQAVKLSPKEYEVLRLLASGPGRVFSSEEILAHAWAGRGFATAQDVKQYIYFLRQKLEENPEQPRLILTVRGFGYKLTG